MVQQSAGGIITREGKVVLVNNRKTGSVTFPKGRVNGGETLEQAALREIREETGLSRIKAVKYLSSYTRLGGTQGLPKEIHLFLYRADTDKLHPEDPETTAEWVALDDVVDRLTYQEDREFFEQHRREY